ncbi:MAG: hypothetical protein RR911_00015 [Oscillospiraceae bacterium]
MKKDNILLDDYCTFLEDVYIDLRNLSLRCTKFDETICTRICGLVGFVGKELERNCELNGSIALDGRLDEYID